MPHPFSLKPWLYPDEAGHALGATEEEQEAFGNLILDLIQDGTLESKRASHGKQTSHAALVAYCNANNILLRRLDPAWVDAPPLHPAEDPHHQYHSRELFAAVSVWRAVVATGEAEASPKGPKAPILAWLKQYFGDLQTEALERIAPVANPHKAPGPPPRRK